MLASNAYSPVQAVEINFGGGRFWGVQYHPEYALDVIALICERSWQSLVDGGMATDREAILAYAAQLRLLHEHPARSDIAWRLGIQPEIIDPQLRLTELRNWIGQFVRPQKSRRGRG